MEGYTSLVPKVKAFYLFTYLQSYTIISRVLSSVSLFLTDTPELSETPLVWETKRESYLSSSGCSIRNPFRETHHLSVHTDNHHLQVVSSSHREGIWVPKKNGNYSSFCVWLRVVNG